MSDERHLATADPFTHKKNIVIGKARVIWAKDMGGKPDSWVLPGGNRTTDFMSAHAVAVQMAKLMAD